MNRLDRLTSILIHLQSKRVVRAQEIADRFGISLRTVYRDVRSLEVAGIPIVGEAGVGYSLEGYRLPPVQFTADEAAAFLTAEKLVGPYTDAGVAGQYSSGMLKIRAVLRLSDKDFIEQLDNAVQVLDARQTAVSMDQILPVLLRAISGKELLSIRYAGKKDEAALQRMIEPIGIFFKNEVWYTLAWCRTREDVRNFRLDRMREVRATGNFFEDRALSLQDYLAENDLHALPLPATLTALREVLPYIERQKKQQGFLSEKVEGPHVKMEFQTLSYEYLARWALQFADKVVALAPLELEQAFTRIVETTHKNLQSAKPC